MDVLSRKEKSVLKTGWMFSYASVQFRKDGVYAKKSPSGAWGFLVSINDAKRGAESIMRREKAWSKPIKYVDHSKDRKIRKY